MNAPIANPEVSLRDCLEEINNALNYWYPTTATADEDERNARHVRLFQFRDRLEVAVERIKNNMKTKNVIEVAEWDALVVKTYGRPYKLQQQDGCRGRGTEEITVPSEASDHERESVNHKEMGVSFKAWMVRDPKKKLPDHDTDYQLELWWERNFYPDVKMVANDLHAKGLLEAGGHLILIDW